MRPNVKCEGDLAVHQISRNTQASITPNGAYLYERSRLVGFIAKSQLRAILRIIEDAEVNEIL